MNQQVLEDDLEMSELRSTDKYSGRFVVRVPRSLHRSLAEMAQREGVTLNLLVNIGLSRLVDRPLEDATSIGNGIGKPKGIRGAISRVIGGDRKPRPPSASTTFDRPVHDDGPNVDESQHRQTGAKTMTKKEGHMSKYAPLGEFLKKVPLSESKKTLAFSDLERVINERLPRSAQQYRPWWANTTGSHVQAHAWLDSGWEVDTVDLLGETVTFRRNP
jgi:hypothetical protein